MPSPQKRSHKVSQVRELPLTDMVSHMREESPNECVGLIFETGPPFRLVNQARSTKRFYVGTTQVSEALEDRGEAVVATYHSHPNGPLVASGEDESFMAFLSLAWPGVIHVILSDSGYVTYHVTDDLEIEQIECQTHDLS